MLQGKHNFIKAKSFSLSCLHRLQLPVTAYPHRIGGEGLTGLFLSAWVLGASQGCSTGCCLLPWLLSIVLHHCFLCCWDTFQGISGTGISCHAREWSHIECFRNRGTALSNLKIVDLILGWSFTHVIRLSGTALAIKHCLPCACCGMLYSGIVTCCPVTSQLGFYTVPINVEALLFYCFSPAPCWEPEGNTINPLTKKIGLMWCSNASQENMNHLPGNQWVERWNISQRDGFHSPHSRRFLLSALQVCTRQILSAAGVVQR